MAAWACPLEPLPRILSQLAPFFLMCDPGDLGDLTSLDQGPDAAGDLSDQVSGDLEDLSLHDNTELTSPDTSLEATEYGVLPKADHEALLAAGAKYNQLLLSQNDEAAARQALVQWLNSGLEGISEAALFEDGYTVVIRFKDGHWGGVFTLDPQSIAGTPPEGSLMENASAGSPSQAGMPQPAMMFDPAPGPKASVPGSRKVLFMDIAHPDFPFADVIWQNLVDRLLGLGWSQSDLVHVERKNDDDLSITPDTWFQMGDYGFVLTLAHGLWGKLAVIKEGTTDLPNAQVTRGYIQCCSAGNYKLVAGEEKVKLWMKWNKQGDVFQLVNKHGAVYMYMSTDILRNELQSLDNTIMVLMTCYGWHHRYAYMDNGAAAVLGWDHVTQIWDALTNLQIMINRMLSGTYETLGHVFDDGAFLMESQGPDTLATLHLGPDSAAVSFPGWAQVTVFSSKSYESAAIRMNIDYMDEAAQDVTDLPMGGWPFPVVYQASALIPGMATITVKAVDPATETVLAYSSVSVNLHPGQNPNIQVDLDAPHPLPYKVFMTEPYLDVDDAMHWHWVLEWDMYPGAVVYAIQGHTAGWQLMGQVDPWWSDQGLLSSSSPDLQPYVAQVANGKRYKSLRPGTATPDMMQSVIDSTQENIDKCTFEIIAMCQNAQGGPMVCP